MKSESPRTDTFEEDFRPLPPLMGFVWTFATIIVAMVLSAIVESFRDEARGDLVTYTFTLGAAYLWVIFAALRVHAPHADARSLLGLGLPRAPVFALAAAVGAGLSPLLSRIASFLASHVPPPSDALVMLNEQLLTAHSVSGKVFRFVAQAVLIPCFQELFFRGMLLGGMRRTRPDDVAIVMVAFFSSMTDLVLGAPALIVGLIAGWLRVRSGSVWSSMALQVGCAMIPLLPTLRGADPLVDPVFSWAWVARGVVLAAGAMALIALLTRKVSEKAVAA